MHPLPAHCGSRAVAWVDLGFLRQGQDFFLEAAHQAPEGAAGKVAASYFLCKETERLLPIIENAENYPEIVRAEVTDTVLRNIEQSADRSGYLIYQNSEKMLF